MTDEYDWQIFERQILTMTEGEKRERIRKQMPMYREAFAAGWYMRNERSRVERALVAASAVCMVIAAAVVWSL